MTSPAHFWCVRQGPHTYEEVLPRRPGWADNILNFFFLSGLQRLEQRAKKCIELRGEYVK